jgi:hypothetical protein
VLITSFSWFIHAALPQFRRKQDRDVRGFSRHALQSKRYRKGICHGGIIHRYIQNVGAPRLLEHGIRFRSECGR